MLKIHSLFPFLKIFLSFFMLSFAAGDSGFAALGGGEASVIADLSEGDGEGDGTPAGDGEESKPEGEGEGAPQTDEEKAAAVAAAQKAGPELSKPLSKGVRKFMGELKQQDPVAWKELNSRLWSLNGIDTKIAEHFEGGLDEAIQTKTNLDTFLKDADFENLEDARKEFDDYRNTDKKITAGDPTFVNDLPEPIQAGIFKMLPHFVQEWQSRDSDGYNRYFAGLVEATLRDTNFAKNFEMAMWKLEEMGTDDPAVKKVHELLTSNLTWMKNLREQATKAPVAKPAAQDDEQSRREKANTQKELELGRRQVGTKFRQYADPLMLGELKKLYPKGVPANVNKAEVFLKAINNLATSFGPKFASTIDQYLAAGDEAGAVKYAQQQASGKRLSEAVTKAHKYLYGEPTLGSRPQIPGDKKPEAGGAAPTAGFIKINYNPKAESIDVAATTKLAQSMKLTYRQLISQSKGVLKNGKKVEWAHDAQDEQ